LNRFRFPILMKVDKDLIEWGLFIQMKMEPELQTSTGSIRTGGNRGLLPALYQTVWRWHFYAGIIFAPFLILLAFSGSMYLFKPQIEGYLYKDLLTVREVGASRLSPDQLSAAVKQQHPGLSIQSITLPDDAKSTVTFSVMNEGAQAVLYADPYDGKVYGMMDAEKTFSSFFKKMHSQLLLSGTLPNRLVEMAACWGIVLTVTGLYLWWPRGRFSIWGTVLPRLGKRGSRPFWRDLHAVPAFWLSLFILILIATGLPWSGVLGGQIDRAANATNTNTPPYAYLFSGQLESITVAKDIADNIPWAAENTPVPNSISGGYVRLSMNEIAAIAERQHVLKPYTITMPRGDSGVYSVSTDHVKPGKEVTLHVDPYSGAVLTDVRYQDFGVMAKLITLGIAFHEGRLFGLANQIIGLVTCLGLVLISAGSYVMWRKRKPSGTLGAPRKPKDKRVMIGVLAIMAVLGILMPLVGLSILAILIVDLVLISRIPALRRWLSS